MKLCGWISVSISLSAYLIIMLAIPLWPPDTTTRMIVIERNDSKSEQVDKMNKLISDWSSEDKAEILNMVADKNLQTFSNTSVSFIYANASQWEYCYRSGKINVNPGAIIARTFSYKGQEELMAYAADTNDIVLARIPTELYRLTVS